MVQPVLLGGLFIGVLSALPIVSVANCCCLWFVSGGVLAAYLYQQNPALPPLGAGRGFLFGALAGAVGAVVWLILASVLQPILAPLQERMIETVLRDMPNMPAETRTMLERMSESSSAALQRALEFVFQLTAGVIFGGAGGAIGASYFRRDVPPALGGPVTPPPLP